MIAHPDTLRRLVAQYEALRQHTSDTDASGGQNLADISYTLCVSTGTRDIESALATAHEHIQAAERLSAQPVNKEAVNGASADAGTLSQS
ncbi:DUF5133 domain-containing protein [Streptomyces iconiensis]|uniref:DUF5133 domain-containing protein n=1 Tax=Streptomyces iconiensis TaxID=1384038 RepID=A0ABT7A9L0_9ACTN|nr:DUF5133 domain-containing protein [Streptomyces iconiensis]MDJ1137980.1 DUF5133 domain-containing protein [Streptomyces iconiensis]